MNLLLGLEILGWLLVVLAGLQLVPTGAALAFGESPWPYLQAAVCGAVFGLPLALSARGPDRRLLPRDAFAVVAGAWITASLFGALPYVFSGTLGVMDALFESTSGFTTTGATVLVVVEDAPHALLLWRATTQWLGGMGIVVFAVAVLPLLGIGGIQLMNAEVPGPVATKLTPRVADTARWLWGLYVGLTVAAFVAFAASGMGAFDALCHALTTLATGGFSTRSESLAAWGPATQWVAIVFMTIAGVNFVLHYRLMRGDLGVWLRDRELHCFLGLIVGFCVLIGFATRGSEVVPGLRDVVFQVVSLMTTTGFGTADYERWTEFAHLLVLPLLVLGGMAGSTAGGMKTLRVLLLWRGMRASIARVVHPHAVIPVRHAGQPVPPEVLTAVAMFGIAYLGVAFLAALVLGASGYDVHTSLSAGLTAVGNVGPGLSEIGPTDHFAHFPGHAKAVLAICMLAGRLEILTLLVVVSPTFWRR